MSHLLQYIIPGITDGSVYAICGLGLVLTYKTSGVFNFGHGALAALAAYMFYQFRDLNHLPWPVAALLALFIVGVIGGLLLERMAHFLRSAPTVTVVVATVGLLVLLEGICTDRYGASSLQFSNFLPQSGFTISQVNVSAGQMITVAFVLGSAVAMFYLFDRVRIGKAMTAVVDDANLLSLQATNPSTVRRLAWILGSSFAAISGILLAPEVGISVTTLILLVITAYGAAAFGLFESLPLTVLGGFLIGIIVDTLPDFTQRYRSETITSLPMNIPFLVLFGVLVFVPARKLTQRGVRNARRFKPIREFSLPITAGGMSLSMAGLIILPFVINQARIDNYAAGLGYVVIFASLGMITWTSGQISLCHLAFAAIGATTMAHMLNAGVPWPFALLIGGLLAVPAGAIVAIPANRLSGIYVAVATFGFGILIQQIFYPSFLMFGVLNNVTLLRPHILGINFTRDRPYYMLCLIITTIALSIVLVIRRSRLGLLLRALSDSPAALDAHGANTKQTRVLIFCIAAFLAGIGGAMIGGVTESASGSQGGTFDFTFSLLLVAILGFAGRRPLFSPFFAAFLFEVIRIYPFFDKTSAINAQPIVFGLLAILVAIGPGIGIARIGKRSREREDGTGPGPMSERMRDVPVKPIQPGIRGGRATVSLRSAVTPGRESRAAGRVTP